MSISKEDARNIVLNPGEIYILSNGQYSDYRIFGAFKVLKILNKDIIMLLVNQVKGSESWIYFPTLIDILLKEGYIEKIETKELYLGAYGDIDMELR